MLQSQVSSPRPGRRRRRARLGPRGPVAKWGGAGADVARDEWMREAVVLRWQPLIGRSGVALAVDMSGAAQTRPAAERERG